MFDLGCEAVLQYNACMYEGNNFFVKIIDHLLLNCSPCDTKHLYGNYTCVKHVILELKDDEHGPESS